MINLLELEANVVSTDLRDYVIGIYGTTGSGKTTIASQFPKPLIIAPDVGFKTLNVHGQSVFSWADILTVKAQLMQPAVKEKFDTIVIDTLDMLMFYLQEHVCSVNNVSTLGDIPYGKGYADVSKALRKLLTDLQAAGYGIVILAHSASEDPETKRKNLKLSENLQNIVVGMMDVLAYIHIQEDGRYLCFQPTPHFHAKSRFTEIIDHCPLSYDNLVSSVREAVGKQTTTSSESQNYYQQAEHSKEDFEQLKAEVVELATSLMTTGEVTRVQKAVEEAFGENQKLSEATITDMDKLIAVKGLLAD